MKRDMGLVREILLAMDTEGRKDFSDAAKAYHHIHLMVGAGLVEKVVTEGATEYTLPNGVTLPAPKRVDYRITWKGMEFLEMIRPDEVWDRIKAVAAQGDVEVSEWLIREVVRNRQGWLSLNPTTPTA